MNSARRPRTLWYAPSPVPTAFAVALRNGWIDEAFRADGIVVRPLEPSDTGAAASLGAPDAFRQGGATAPLVARSRGEDVRVIGLSPPASAASGPVALTVSGALLDERPDLVQRWLVLLLSAARWARTRPVGGPDAQPNLDIDLSPALLAALTAEHDALHARGALAEAVDIRALVDPAPLAAARAALGRPAPAVAA